MNTIKTVERFAGTIVETTIEIETRPAVVDYRDILESCEVLPDDDMGAPWDEYCGWDHELERTQDDGQEDSRAYVSEKNRVVVLDDREFRDLYQWHRKRGCSRQVSAEMVALTKRQRMDTIVGWRENGYEWHGVACEFMGKRASVWGIDDYGYAYSDVRHDIAYEVAAELEEDGYTVTHRPDPIKQDRQARREQFKRNLLLDCWTD